MDDSPSLTLRQLEVLELLAHGATERAAAATMGIEYTTARRHTYNARRRLGALNTTHAVAIVVARGLIQIKVLAA